MTAFQRYCKVHQQKMLFFTIVFGAITLAGIVYIPMLIADRELSYLTEDKIARQLMFGFPITFVILLFVQRVFSFYVNGNFFSKPALVTLQHLSRICLLYGLIVQPGSMLTIEYFSLETDIERLIVIHGYLLVINYPISILGYALHLVSGTHKIAREIYEEQELTV